MLDGIQFDRTNELHLQRRANNGNFLLLCILSLRFSIRMFGRLLSIAAILLHFYQNFGISITFSVSGNGRRKYLRCDSTEELCFPFSLNGMSGTFIDNFSHNYKYFGRKHYKKKFEKYFQSSISPHSSEYSCFNLMKRNVLKGPTKLYMSTDDERLRVLQDLTSHQAPILEDPNWNPSLPLLEIKDLHAETEDDKQKILNGVSLKIFRGEKHAIMGRNGSGKSTLSKIIAGHPSYRVTSGTMTYKGTNLLAMPVDYRSIAGIFLAFQYPVEIPIVKNSEFLRVAINEHRRWRNETEIDPLEFNVMMYEKLQLVGLADDFIERPLNYGFSGGEKKRNEILQLLMLQPTLCLLDETDSGLDVDSFKITAEAVKNYGSNENSFVIVTHYKKLLDLLKPDYIHIMHQGKIVMTGNMTIAAQLEHSGFAQFLQE